ncbi:MAG: right-handed parallel beta-helix repeat-containing protein [candidate division Zixibacteria bacterium]|nr:right-handed parallel beta-helix repeat-containing protein [Candidatus Tariuqbacter arcticus]
MRRIHYILVTLLICLSLYEVSSAQLSGPLSGTIGPGTYTVIGDILVQNGDSLTIEPGTIFLFEGNYEFDINGYLFAVGIETDSIKFMPSDSDSTWGGIDFNDSAHDSSKLDYCFISSGSALGMDPIFGGGIYISATNPTISNCTIAGNSAYIGGGIFCGSCSPTISNCSITENSAVAEGGGIDCWSSSPTILNCIISGNSAGSLGSGITCYSFSDPLISNCNISGNSGSGIGLWRSSPSIINTHVENNTGFGIDCNFASIPIISYSTIMNNSNSGIVCDDGSNPLIEFCTISANNSNNDGGGIDCWDSDPIILNCIISGNSADDAGGGIYSAYSSPTIVNTIIEGNTGNGGVYFYYSPYASVTYSDFYNNENGNFTGNPTANLGQIVSQNANGDSCDVFFNIFFDPLFYLTSGDSAYFLTVNSPCIDAGDPTSPFDPDSTISDIGVFYYDQSGTPVSRQDISFKPGEFTLYVPYPNPFNPVTNLNFSLPNNSYVSLIVYDIQGREITRLIDGFQPAGIYQRTFDASGLASGIYFAYLKAEGFSQTRKLLLIK